jgi:carboxypeptidase family protein
MHNQRRLICLAMLAVVTFAPARDARACSCERSGPPCQNAFQVDAVFEGTVQSVIALPDEGPPLRPGEFRIPRTVRVEFAAVVGYRGMQASTASVLTAGSGPACGYTFKRAERYLVYATRSANGGLVTGVCSRTRPLVEAGEDLGFLRTLAEPSEPRARVYGTVTNWGQRPAGESRTYSPVPDVLVSVRSQATAVEARTDERGRYEITVPPGKYEITAYPPAVFSARHLQRTVELRDARACAVVDFGVRFDGRIKGVVRQSSGEPAAEASVEIVDADAGDARSGARIPMDRAETDVNGTFEFTELSPGRYIVGVDLTRRSSARVVFPTTFYPGTADRSLSAVVQLAEGQHRDLEPMRLPPPRRAYRLTGTVSFDDGRAAAGVGVYLMDGANQFAQVGGATTGPDGVFSVLVHEGLSYIAGASYWDEANRRQLNGRTGPFVIGGDTQPLRIVLSAGR